MSDQRKMKLVLADGSEFCGTGNGADEIVVGEVIFNTAMVGYQEILSDPSYAGQIVIMTYPLMGQYGITDEDFESKTKGGPAALVVRELCDTPSNFRSTATMAEFLEERGIPCLSGVDTRMITRKVRESSPITGAVVPQDMPVNEAVKLISETKVDEDITSRVSCNTRWFSRTPHHKRDVVVIDCGLKRSIIAELNRLGCNVTVVPFNASTQDILSFNPAGILISSGPGNPANLGSIVEIINNLKGSLPICGIGLGHQLIGISYGAKVVRIGCGHHGGHPVRETKTGRIFTAEHNHCNAIDYESVKATDLTITHIDAADGVVEGIECIKDKVFSCEFTPEGCPGPQESNFFEKFIKLMED